MANPTQQTLTRNNAPATAPKKDATPELKTEAKTEDTAAPAAPPATATEFPPVPGSTKKPTRAECKLALDEVIKQDAEVERVMFLRNKAIQTLIDAGYDSKPLKMAGKPVTFRKRLPRVGEDGSKTHVYYIDPYKVEEPDDFTQV